MKIKKLFVFPLLLSLTASGVTGTTALAANTNTATETLTETLAEETGLADYGAYTSVEISSAEDLIDLADRCQDTSASEQLYVVLSKDISLIDEKFNGIPYFNGVFDGAGYTISGLDISGKLQPAGLIGITGENAVILNLNTSGNIKPAGEGNYVGGIVGINRGLIYGCSFNGVAVGETYVGGIAGSNEATGTIKNSTSSGAVRGDVMAGGIAGINTGMISGCTNKAQVDTESFEPTIKVADLDLAVDLDNINTQSMTGSITDIGGICGYNSGTIQDSDNYATVGYAHTGYNVGGIVGRSSGFVYEATNAGTVYGRKDVAGIAGQMEPYVSTNLSTSDLKKLSDAMDTMEGLVDQLSADSKSAGKNIEKSTDNITNYMSSIDSGAQDLYDSTVGKGNDISEADVKKRVEDAAGAVEDGVSDVIDKTKDEELPDFKLPDIGEGQDEEKTEVDTEEVKSTTEKISSEIYSEIEKARNSSKNAVENSKLRSNISGLNAEIKTLNSTLSGSSDAISADLDRINAQYDVISGIIENAGSDDLVTDLSRVNPASSTYGAVRSCVNEGNVQGDVNVGGATGSMGQESTVDPEDDIDFEIDTDTRKTYSYVTVLYDFVNRGRIESKRNYTGGIAGRADIGYIASSESYGSIDAEGDYVGGIAGYASITIEDCLTKTTLSGGSYVGGILGLGVTETADGTGSLVANCKTLVEIEEAEQFYGAIAGDDAGDFKDNTFTSDTLAGINRISTTGKAEKVDFATLTADENLSEEFTTLTVKFIAEDTELKSISFHYGDSIKESEFPTLPQKEGYYAHWDKTDLSSLKIDTTVTAVYTSYITSLDAEPKRSNGRSVFYVEGNFSDDESMTVEEAEASDFISTSGEILEVWNISIPEDGLTEHTIRYLPIVDADDIEIYVKADGSSWTKTETGSVGNYLTIPVTGTSVGLLVMQKPMTMRIVIFTAVLVLIFLCLIALNIKAIANKKKKLKALTEEKAHTLSGQTQETGKMSEEEIRINERIDKAGRALKKGAIAVRILLTLIVALIVAGVGIWILAPQSINRAFAGYYLGKVAADESLQCEVSVTVEDGDTQEVDALLTKTTEDGISYTVIEENGLTLYLAENAVYLENGNGFRLSGLVPNYESALTVLSPLYEASTVTRQAGDGGTLYEITISDEDALELLKTLVPNLSDEVTAAGEMKISLVVSNFTVKRIDFEGQGTLHEKEDIGIKATITLIEEDRTAVEIPSAVSDAVAAGTAADVELSPELMDLLMAYAQFREQNPAACDVLITATGGSLSVSDTITWFRKQIDGEWINSIGKNGINLYYTDKAACTEGGVTLTESQQETVDIGQILDMAYLLCQTADLSTSANSYETYYEISLDEESMTKLAEIIAPQITDSDIHLKKGALTFTVADGKLTDIAVEIEGSVKLFVFTENLSLSADFKVISDPVEENYQIPSTVSEVLIP